jgi:D-aminopeptidase
VSPDWAKTPAGKTRGRGFGLAWPGTPGRFNAITDVAGVEVGVVTLIEGDDIRTGVTAILPRGRTKAHTPCSAGSFSFNGNGEMSGLAWIEEAGELQTPITITNTASCGVTRDATLQWLVKNKIGTGQDWGLPVAAETYDGDLNDINGFHVTAAHTMQALDNARGGAVELGSVGGGTGMITYDFKAGNGSASRLVEIDGETFTLGIFVQSNFGQREDFTVLGVPVGQHILQDKLRGKDQGSIIAIIATDAPLLPHQLKRLARRVPMGLARTGTIGSNSSGDIFLAFSTANEISFTRSGKRNADYLANDSIDGLFRAVIEVTEEAVLDSMICNDTMVGRNGNTSIALPVEQMTEIMKRYGQLQNIAQ